jgi:uncharacterized protein (TIGR03435 family)
VKRGIGATLLIGCGLAVGQKLQPAFEVASVKQVGSAGVMGAPPSGPAPKDAPLTMANPGYVHFRNMPMFVLLMEAYGVRKDQIQGPDWMNSEKYDISAKVPAGTPKQQLPLMLQNLLIERFRMKVHWQTNDEPVLVLTAGEAAAKLEKSEHQIEAQVGDHNVPAAGLRYGKDGLEIPMVNMPLFANTLALLLKKPVLDQTGIEGTYDITVPMSIDDMRDDYLGAIQDGVKRLGFGLESRRAPVNHLVIESAAKTPVEN